MIQIFNNDEQVIEILKAQNRYEWFMELVKALPTEVNIASWGEDITPGDRTAFFYFYNFENETDNGYVAVLMSEGNELEQEVFENTIRKMAGKEVAFVRYRTDKD